MSTPASAGTWSCQGTTQSDHNSWRRRRTSSQKKMHRRATEKPASLPVLKGVIMRFMMSFRFCPPAFSWRTGQGWQMHNYFNHFGLLNLNLDVSFTQSIISPHEPDSFLCRFSSNHFLELEKRWAFASGFISTCDQVSPEGHGEPDGHHHVGRAAILRRENSQKITPDLKI